MPDSVLGRFTAGICFGAVAMPESGVYTQRNLAAGQALAVLLDHVRRSRIDVEPFFNHQINCFAIKNIGRVNDRIRIAGVLKPRRDRFCMELTTRYQLLTQAIRRKKLNP